MRAALLSCHPLVKRAITCVVLLGAALATSVAPAAASSSGAHALGSHPTDYCDGCEPPLVYSGGHVLDTHGRQGVMVTPIYWSPPDAQDQFSGTYVGVVDRYLADVAAASGASTNVYSINSEYYDIFGGPPNHISYRITAGAPVADTHPFPRNACRPAPGYHACIGEDQMVSELNAVLAARHLPRGLAHFYPVFFPPGVETIGSDGSTSVDSYCGFHSSAGAGASLLVYANEPYITDGCLSGQSPNGDPAADSEVSILSHELSEATTDPDQGGTTGWRDRSGSEIGDLCNFHSGPPLASANPAAPQSTEFNQVINGRFYYTQTEFSNYAYNRFGVGKGCQPSESAAQNSSTATAGSEVKVTSYPAPTSLPADGRSTGSISYIATGKNGVPESRDRLNLSTYLLSGTGTCGTIRPQTIRTDSSGGADVTYRASRSNAACVVVANDAVGGRSVSAIFYQGRTAASAPTSDDTLPGILRAGHSRTFTTSFGNPTRHPLHDATVQFFIFPFDNRSPNLRASQFALYVSWHGRPGPFSRVRLAGSTQGDSGIDGSIGPASGFTIGARHTQTLTYHLVTRRGVPRNRRGPIVSLSAILSQLDPASGDTTALGYTINDARVR